MKRITSGAPGGSAEGTPSRGTHDAEHGAVAPTVASGASGQPSAEALAALLALHHDACFEMTLDGAVAGVASAAKPGTPQETMVLVEALARRLADNTERERLVDELRRAGRVVDRELDLTCANDERRWCSLTAILVASTEPGRPEKIVGVLSDTAARRALESRVRQAMRTEAAGLRAAGVIHDFNNLLAGIAANAEILRLELGGQPLVDDTAGSIVRAAKRAAALASQILAFPTADRPGPTVVDMHGVIAEVVMWLKRRSDRRIAVVQHLAAAKSTVYGNAGELHTLVAVVMLNACGSMPDGGTLTIETAVVNIDEVHGRSGAQAGRPRPCLQIRVIDSGSQMAPEALRRFLEPFIAGDKRATKQAAAPPGEDAAVPAGALDVQPRPGGGSIVDIHLPVHGEPDAAPMP